MRPQSEIDQLLQQFIGATAGQKVDYYGYAGECLSLDKRWVDVVRNGNLNGQMGAPPSTDGWGSGYWSQPPQQIEELFIKQAYDPNSHYPAGSLFVNVRTHHIGILLDNQPGQPTAYVYQQNANPDGSPAHTGQRSKANIDGILVLRVAAPQPVVTHQVTDYSSPIKYNVQEGKNEWDLSGNTFAEIASHPVDTAGPGKVITAVAVLHIQGSDVEQYQYYLEDRNSLRGWNSADCTPYVAPPKPYVPPAAPITAPLAEKYEVLVQLDGFKSAADAKNQQNYYQPVGPGSYFVYKRDIDMLNISTDNQKAGVWVNPKFNEVPAAPSQPVDIVTPVSEPVDPPKTIEQPVNLVTPESTQKLHYTWLEPNQQPVWFHTLNVSQQVFKDLENPDTVAPVGLPPNKNIRFSMWTQKGSVVYYIPTVSIEKGYRHGVPETILHEIGTQLPKQNILQESEQETTKWLDFIETGFKSAERLVLDIKPHISKTTYKATQLFMDGVKAGKRK